MKLNKEIREAICKNAMAKTGLIDEVKALMKRYAAFAEKCRVIANDGIKDSVLEKAQAAFIAKVPCKLHNTRSSNVLRADSDIYLNIGGMRFSAYFSGSNGVPDHVQELLYISKSDLYSHVLKACPHEVTITDESLVQEFHDLEDAKKDLSDRILKAKQYVSGYVNSVTTAEKLVKVWPEAAALLPKETAVPVISNLPAIPVTELNKMFNLP